MADTTIVHGVIPLARAVLCLEPDCETVFHVHDGACPRCTSRTFKPIAAWLKAVGNGQPKTAVPEIATARAGTWAYRLLPEW